MKKLIQFGGGIAFAVTLLLCGCGKTVLHGTYRAYIQERSGRLVTTIEFLDAQNCRISSKFDYEPNPTVEILSYKVIDGKVLNILDTELSGEIVDSDTLILKEQTYKRIQ